MKEFSKRAIWKAVNSAHGDRLVEIALEHTKLAKELICSRNIGGVDVEILDSRIVALREERDGILELFEDGDGE